ncbi:Dynein heavy chain family protein [Trichomonas vaginalis G3]|uniref:Dynein-1, subspecies f n=1 Tax=Trichomonas vaginalis (strain ATCC PRA-98 / G3) TaxID=412133 RepID=A2DXJ7_TRIV3|nr:dynein light chain binding [Trichomonas vaginalis G3]EAY14826.1 Dynein heavy chain family protein [Trichomonas vaginalis G3]KAI5541193.1 dynein light chain binding [Trichomonas vaginalis G3]|eukprot:XP_001327049.1 Dynein heavy chain family protein [Trichomonas vaginalis G3]
MTDRFNKAKNRLVSHEQVVQKERTLKKQLITQLPDETVVVPKIGEWVLSRPVSPDTQDIPKLKLQKKATQKNTSRAPIAPSPKKTGRGTALGYNFNPNPTARPKTALEAPYHLKPPKSIIENSGRTTSRLNYPPGTVTTDLDAIEHSRFRQAPKALPPIQDRTVEEQEPTFLPLEYFDDSTYEEFPIEDLMKTPQAFSRYQELNGDSYWARCTVLKMEPDTGLFVIEWQGSKKRKKVARFNLRFERENEKKFQLRVEAARKRCRLFETEFRFHNRVQQMSTEGLPELSEEDMDDITKIMNIDNIKLYEKLQKELFEEVKQNFKYINNKLDFEYNIKLNPLIPNRDEFMALFQDPPPAPEYGLVCYPKINFNELHTKLNGIHLYGNINILNGVKFIWRTFQDSINVTFLIDGLPNTCSLEEFMSVEFQQLESTAKTFKSTMQETLESSIGATINDEIGSKNTYEKAKFEKMVTLVTHMLHTVLLTIVDNTVKKYLSLFTKFTSKDNATLKPQFFVELILDDEKHISLLPSIDAFHEQFIGLLHSLESTVNNLPIINLPSVEVDSSNVSFEDCGKLIQSTRNEIEEPLKELFSGLEKFLDQFRSIENTLGLDPSGFAKQFDPDGKEPLDKYRKQLDEFGKVMDVLQNQLNSQYTIGPFYIKCEHFKEQSIYHTKALIIALLEHMKEFAICDIKGLQQEFNTINEKITITPKTPEELEKLKIFMDNVLETTKERHRKMNTTMERFTFLEEFKYTVSDQELKEKYKTLQMPHKLSMLIDETETKLSVERIRMVRELRNNQRKLESDVMEITQLLPNIVSKYQDLEMTVEAADQVNEIQAKLVEFKNQQETYNRHEKIFNYEPGTCRILSKVIEEFQPLHMLWNLAADWLNQSTSWLDEPFPRIKPDQISQFMNQATKKIARLKKDLVNHPTLIEKVLLPLSEQIDNFKQSLPLITKLRHPGIKTKHWEQISEIVGFKVFSSTEMTLQNFLDYNLGRWQVQIFEIAAVAAQEYNIESSLDAMDSELQTKKFETSIFRDTGSYIVTGADDLISTIDDQLVTTQTLLTSPFIAPSKKRATENLEFLRKCHQILDAWVECQRGWLYLQPIFTGTSIQQKLHREARDWNNVDKSWNNIMTQTHAHPEFQTVMHRDHLLEDFLENNKLLDSITQGLNQYLEAKRLGFPRFFFLSNDELISILSHTKDFDQIQKSMNKLFEYVNTITVDEDMMITAMNDDGLETVKLVNHVDGDTPEVEDWLNAFEDEMRNTLKESITNALPAAKKKKREVWINEFPAQVILISNQIMWTQQVTDVLSQQKLRGLKVLQSKFIEGLEGLTAIIRQPLSLSTRQVISCLLILEVHNRDIITDLIKQEVVDVESFKWIQQLRYYWEDNTVNVRSINNVYEYSYEYAGNSARLVITPLTDRCYQTLLAAFKQNMSGAPSGPAGTGKTETVRDCAKALGRACVVYNCSEEVTPEQMSQFFAGLASSGSWSCFDEFNRINIEVLSVIAQQVRTIQNAISSNLETFQLDARQLKLNPNAAICITMNPGYAGRTELPDNLKALFRPCAMMVPDFVFISEILLFSGGFASASALSVKLVALFDICRKQLSNAHHYDWGLRAMKAILTTAGKSKRANLDAYEALLLVNSIRDCTVPRLVKVDVPLFEGIIHDVFPDVDAKKEIQMTLKDALTKGFQSMNMQPLPSFLTKCNEIYETTVVRHGLMLVGGAMSGKTTCRNALKAAMDMLAETEKDWKKVHVDLLNPKSITIPELYGLFDPVTSGWSDGVLSNFIRTESMSEPTEWKWIVVDGPVDSLWIETMNSLLDDNKVLCLSNNERISLGAHVKMMFEVDDLSQASPATVSRCGMIYFDQSQLEWSAITNSWIQTLPEKLQELGEFLGGLFEKYLPPMIQFIEVDANVVVGSNPMFVVKNFLRLLTCFLDIIREPVEQKSADDDELVKVDPLKHENYFSPFANNGDTSFGYIETTDDLHTHFHRIVLFALVWSFGAVIDEGSRQTFDKFIRAQADENSTTPFPQKSTVYDFYVDFARNSWMAWCDGQTGISITANKPIEQQLIPTNESAAMTYISRLTVQHGIHTLFHGPESSKSLVINTLMQNILDKSFDCRNLPLANCSTTQNVLKTLRSFMHKHHGVFGPLTNMQLVIFLDNINSVKPEIYGAQPPLELIRQMLDAGGWYNTAQIEFQRVADTTLISAMGPEGGGLFSIPQRLLRHFYFMHIPKYKRPSMATILNALISMKLQKHGASIQELARSASSACLDIYEMCIKNLLPIPSKLHYIFSLRNIIRVVKGIFQVPASDCGSEQIFIRSWHHEMCREFFDRFNTQKDRTWFLQALSETCSKHFHQSIESICPAKVAYFNNFSDKSGIYRESKLKPEELLQTCKDVLDEHNRESSKQLDIVLFSEAVDHISSLTRILGMPRGHAMLVGVKSSGRKSLAHLALHMQGIEIFEIAITRSYNFTEWREDLKKLMINMGTNDQPTGFIISDVQIVGSFQLEDISNLLIDGVIQNLFERDEMEKIKADLITKEVLTDEDPWKLFIDRVKKHLHIILVFSPYGSCFRESMLAYPSLRTEVTIDWYMPWSNEALESVGRASLSHGSLAGSQYIQNVVNVCVKIHKSVEEAAQKFLSETKRFTAVTPSRYFELINTFNTFLVHETEKNNELITKYTNGVDKIETTRTQILGLSQQLDRDIPILNKKQDEVQEMLKDLGAKQADVEKIREDVKKQSELAEAEAAEATRTNDIAQAEVEKAQPLLDSAIEAVDKIDNNSLSNIKQLKSIHPALRETFEAICIIFGRRPRKVEGPTPGSKIDDYWPETLSLLADSNFVKKVKSFQPDTMSKETISKLAKYVPKSQKERDEKLAAAQSGYAAVGNLYRWVCASYQYWFVWQDILPLKKAAEEAQQKLDASMAALAASRAKLKEVEDKLAELVNSVELKKAEAKKLADSVADTQLRLDRAQKIMSGLSGETKRWGETADNLNSHAGYLMGDSLLIAGSLTHLGAFSPLYRTRLLEKWKSVLTVENIIFTKTFSITNNLGTESVIRDWVVKGLPNDTHSIENALIINSHKISYPLFIDPQLSGTKWLRAIMGEQLKVLRFDQSNFLQQLKVCITVGSPVLIENVGLKMDPLIEPLLSREQMMIDGQKKITIGGESIPFNDNFRLFISTKYPNPHYSPEVCSQVTLINFTTTLEGLSDLLMNNLIEVEREDLDGKRLQLMEEQAENTRRLKEVEEEILQIVSNAGSDILSDDAAIKTLQNVKKTSRDIAAQMAAAESTEKQIAEFRNTFSPVSQRAALLYFCASDFAVVDPMYQFSLKWFVNIFKNAVHDAEHPSDIERKIEAFNNAIATKFYQNVTFSLFARHKLLFSTLMATRILISEKKISTNELGFLLQPIPRDEPSPAEWMPQDVWSLVSALPNVSEVFKDLPDHVTRNLNTWEHYYNSTTPETMEIPYDKELSPFEKLLVLRVFHLHRVREGLRIFVSSTLGKNFVTPPPLNLGKVFRESSPLSPLIFIITPGIDPQDEIIGVAQSMELERYLKSYSLGRGRGAGAEELIQDASERGFWVLLQNCHLSLSWMPRLEHIIDNLDPAKVHDRFRLCLVTMSSPDFPIGVLYQGAKLIYEIPKGIRENMIRIYSGFNADDFNENCTPSERQLTFHLAFFHAVVLERLQFGSIGWNIPYEFNPSDFAISLKHLKMFLGESQGGDVPFEALSYVIGELNYGGRVTDRWDRRTLLSLLQRFFSEEMNRPDFTFGARYPHPEYTNTLDKFDSLINSWPITTEGEDVGLSKNASTITARNDALGIFNSLIEIQPTLIAQGGEISEEAFAIKMVENLISQIPQDFNIHNFVRKFDLNDTINTVLHHEILLYNRLMAEIRKSLSTLQDGLNGLIVMNDSMELLNRRILANKVPEQWLEYSFPSILSLRHYMEDLKKRVEFLSHWVQYGRPTVFSLGAFFHPEEFLTAVLQVYARKHSVPFDTLSWTTRILNETNSSKLAEEPEDGIYVEGLYIEGAKWDISNKSLVECKQKELISVLPVMHLCPTEKTNTIDQKTVYECPMYRTQNRGSGALGLPNYIMSLYIPSSDVLPDHWIQRSVAVFITVAV